jgi:hypothetical protein
MTAGASYRRRADDTRPASRLPRRTRMVVVAAEAAVAAVVGGIAVGGALGWTVAALGALAGAVVGLVLFDRRPRLMALQQPAANDVTARLNVHPVVSRSSGEVGVLGDAQGYAAGVELDIARGALVDLGALCAVAAADPSRPSALQIRVTTYAPPAPPGAAPRRVAGAVHRRVHVLLRFDPAWTADVVAAHGGGAQGSRAALVAAVDRLAARLRGAGIANRVLDAAAVNALVAEDTSPDLHTRVFAADATSRGDLDRLAAVLERVAPERAILSIGVDLTNADEWQSFVAVLVGGRDAGPADAASAAVLADPSVAGVAPPSAIATVLPLGGGPGDLAPVLTLVRA